MSIHGVFNAPDGETHLCELRIRGQGPSLDQLLSCDGWRPFQCEPGGRQAAHPTPVVGITVVLNGRMDISVAAGDLREIGVTPGDMLVLTDTIAPGHATSVVGPDMLRVFGVTIETEPWPILQAAFEGWPDYAVAP